MKKKSMSGVLVLLVFAAFMVSVLLVLLSGADTVQTLTQRDRRTYHHRTAVQYLTTKVRQSDSRHALRTESFGDGDALVYREELDGESFETRIYCYDGYLYELFCREGYVPEPEFGEKILPADSLSVSDTGDCFEVRITAGGNEDTLRCMVRSRKEGM